MSLLSKIKPQKGSVKNRKRLGRGDSSGQGSTAGKGHKGQKARSGGKVRRGFEGGQMPLMRRLPKIGFTNQKFKTEYSVVTLNQLELLDGEISPDVLYHKGYIKKDLPVKILATGKLSKKLVVKAHKFSKQAQAAIENVGGKIEVIK